MYSNETEVASQLREQKQERLMVDVAQLAFFKKAEKAKELGKEVTLNSTQSLFQLAIEPVAKRIKDEIDLALSPQPGVKKLHWHSLKDDSPLDLSAIVCHEAISIGTYGGKAVDVESRISRRIQELRTWKAHEKLNRNYVKRLTKFLNKNPSGEYKRHKLTQAAKRSGVDYKTHKLDMGVGAVLLKIFILETGLMDEFKVSVGNKKKEARVQFKPVVREKLAKQHGQFGELFPDRMPMLCKPDPWTNLSDGGYLCNSLSGGLIRHASEEYMREADVNDIKPMLDGVNRIQETGFIVNQRVHVLADYLFYHKGQGNLNTKTLPEPAVRSGEPVLEDYPFALPGMTNKEHNAAYKQWMKEDPKVAKRFNKHRRAVKESYNEEISKWESTKNTLKVATVLNQMPGLNFRLDTDFKKMTKGLYEKPEDSFWFPISTDFRGRNYALSKHLNLQGGSLQKGLLEFAKPEAVGKRGVHWLMVALANALGTAPDGTKVDKMTFDDRAKWVLEHYEDIMKTADSYEFHMTDSGKFITPSFEYTKYFESADSPWEFIAIAFELTDYWRNPSPEFESHAIVLLDAAQSGIQHLTGLILDPESARYTNVLPNAKPYDMYNRVAETVQERMESKLLQDIPFTLSQDFNETNNHYEVYATIKLFKEEKKPFRCSIFRGDTEAEALDFIESNTFKPADIISRWVGKVDRKLCKKPCMTKVYNSKMYRQNMFIEEFLDDQIKSGKYLDDNGYATDVLGFDMEPDEQNPLRWACIRYLTMELWHTVDSVVSGPARIMAWKNEVAEIIAKQKQFIYWTSPIGLMVSQSTHKYRKGKVINVDLKVQQIKGIPARARRQGYFPTDGVKVSEATRAFSPNFTHSLDAAMLLDCVNKSYDKGVRNYAFIHDAYGTSAASIELLIQSAKEAYAEMYSEDVLGRLYKELQAQSTEPLPKPPAVGKLDVTEVLTSDYFIA
jgi:DNA-directed RNA polymerase